MYLQPNEQGQDPLVQPSAAGVNIDLQRKLEPFTEIFEETLSMLDQLRNHPATRSSSATFTNAEHERDDYTASQQAAHLSKQAIALRDLENLFNHVADKEEKGKGILEQHEGQSENRSGGLKVSLPGDLQDAFDPILEILNSFVKDIEKHQLLSRRDLKVFVNGQNKQKMIASYITQSLHSIQSAGALVYKISYLNFDLKLMFLNNVFGEKISSITKLLDDDNWKKIEYEFLEKAIEFRSQKTPDGQEETLSDLWLMMGSVKIMAFSDHLSEPDKRSQEGQLKNLLSKMFGALELKAAESSWISPTYMIDLKIFHNILRFLGRYHVFTGSISLVAQEFPELGMFEAAIALISSAVLLNHQIHRSPQYVKADGCVTNLKSPLEILMFTENKDELVAYSSGSGDERVSVEDLPEFLKYDEAVRRSLQFFAFTNLAFIYRRQIYDNLTQGSGVLEGFLQSSLEISANWLPEVVEHFLIARM